MDERQKPNLEDCGDGTIFFQPADHINDLQEMAAPAENPVEDRLESAQELPSLFPEEPRPSQEPTLPPTVVERPRKKKTSGIWKVLLVVGKLLFGLLLACCVLVVGLVGYLTVTEYNPAFAEQAQRGGVSSNTAVTDTNLRIVTFNTGYAALGEDADFFMDGGKGVNPDDPELVVENMIGIRNILKRVEADVILLQEVDTDSARSFHQNQWLQYEYDLEDYESRFALNYSCDFVPYPVPRMMGKVQSGIATYSRFDISSATRYSLPCPFSWPARAANLKRCMLVTRIPIENITVTDEDGAAYKELVVVNVHLEAYDDGEGKAAQTKQVLDFIQAEYAKGNYVIVGGDFNQTFPNAVGIYPIKDKKLWAPGVLEELPQDWKYVYDGSEPTCRLLNQPYDPDDDDTQYYIIDGFIVSPNITVNTVETLDEDFLYSDHNPVVMEITLKIE